MANKKRTKPKEEKVKASELKSKRTADFASIYTNAVRCGYTKWDIQTIIGQIEVTLDEEQQVIHEKAVLTMSPTHAKAFLTVFTKNIDQYEQEHGEIKVSEEDLKNIEQVKKKTK